MKRYVLYYKFGSINFYQRLFFSGVDEAKDFVAENNFTDWRILDFYKGEIVESMSNPVIPKK